jgi:hypothetical protein
MARVALPALRVLVLAAYVTPFARRPVVELCTARIHRRDALCI